ncbi:hypothetical protein G7K_4591-t1 [Saitoella complicata NRRL Y-17804]|uniref:Uncharacterized protein n=1 Tax=Saitoella complicata (strain BCRC 22490 / CBS 7301 / JCM 7358 / NBRC 10748 / NRRL Y-17804) TaxID=698492 RepID=A0A0E9NKR7_SAICN|nr:hypothetical protein G7K_4591-t1 [Saitoella complicata NRRL Y-17804]
MIYLFWITRINNQVIRGFTGDGNSKHSFGPEKEKTGRTEDVDHAGCAFFFLLFQLFICTACYGALDGHSLVYLSFLGLVIYYLLAAVAFLDTYTYTHYRRDCIIITLTRFNARYMSQAPCP